MDTQEQPKMLTPQEVADHFGVSRPTVYRWIEVGIIASVRTPGRGHRISASVLEQRVFEPMVDES